MNTVRCSRCGAKIRRPTKTWSVTMGKAKRTKVVFGIFKCNRCQMKFKASIRKEPLPPAKSTQFYPPPSVTMYI